MGRISYDKIIKQFTLRAHTYANFLYDWEKQLSPLFSFSAQQLKVETFRESIIEMNLKDNVINFLSSLPSNSVVRQTEEDCEKILDGFVSLVEQIDLLNLHFTNETSSAGPVSKKTLKIYNAWLTTPFNPQDAVRVFNQITTMRVMHNMLTQKFVGCFIKMNRLNEKYKTKSDALITALLRTTVIRKLQGTKKEIRTAISGIDEVQNKIITELNNADKALTDFYAKREYFAMILMGREVNLFI